MNFPVHVKAFPQWKLLKVSFANRKEKEKRTDAGQAKKEKKNLFLSPFYGQL